MSEEIKKILLNLQSEFIGKVPFLKVHCLYERTSVTIQPSENLELVCAHFGLTPRLEQGDEVTDYDNISSLIDDFAEIVRAQMTKEDV